MRVMTLANINTINSREVAPMIGKDHAHLCRDIQGYIEDISANPSLDSLNYFMESSYTDKQGKPRKCYRITKMGCEFVGNKMQGTKGNQFTAMYVKRFNEMEQEQHQAPALPDFTNPAVAARAWAEQFEKRELVEKENLALTAQIETLKPKADYTDKILQSKGTVPITAIAKDYGMSGTAMNQKLHELKIIYKIGKQWVLYADYQAKGYTHSTTIHFKHKNGLDDVTMNTEWTQKGRLFLYEKIEEAWYLADD